MSTKRLALMFLLPAAAFAVAGCTPDPVYDDVYDDEILDEDEGILDDDDDLYERGVYDREGPFEEDFEDDGVFEDEGVSN